MVSTKIVLDTVQKTILKKITGQREVKVSLQERAKIIEYLGDGYSNMRVERETGIKLEKAKRWRTKWLINEAIFSKIRNDFEGRALEKEMEKAIIKCLTDEARAGAPCKISSEQYCQILGVALESPDKSDRPITEWTLTELTEEVIKRGIVKTISRSQMGSFLKGKRFKTP